MNGILNTHPRDKENKEVPHMEYDGGLVTGQNCLSSDMVTQKSIEISRQVKAKSN